MKTIVSRGELQRRDGRYEEAVADFDRALALDPDNAWALARRASARLMLASRHQRLGTRCSFAHEKLQERYRPILADLDRALAKMPDDIWIRTQKIDALRCMKQFQECLDECTHLLKLKPDFAWAYRRRAWAYRWMLWFDHALDDIERAIALQPGDAYSEAYRAIIYAMMRRTDESLAELMRIVAGDEALIEYWSIEIGMFLVYAGRYGEAMSWLERGVTRKDAHYAFYFIALAKVLRDGEAGARREIDIARTAAQATLETEGQTAGEYMLAGLNVIEGRIREAVEALEPVLKVSDMFIELALYDPIVRPICGHPRLLSVITNRIENHPAMKYFRVDMPKPSADTR